MNAGLKTLFLSENSLGITHMLLLIYTHTHTRTHTHYKELALSTTKENYF